MHGKKLLVLAAVLAAAVVIARRARAAGTSSPAGTLAPVDQPELGPIVITPGPLVLPTVPHFDAPAPSVLESIAQTLGGAVEQVTDALKGLGLWSHKVPEKFRALFAGAAANYGLPRGLLEAVAYRESRYRQDIIDGRVRSSAGAVGIMQIVPRWHPEVGEAGALDPSRAVPYAARYLRQLFNRFGTWRYALAAYNWGPGNLSEAIKRGTPNRWPAETVAYVAEISGNARLA